MENEILEILKTINGRFDKLEEKVDKLDEGQKKIVARIDKVDARLDKIDVRLDNLENGQREIKAKLDDMTDDMTRELSNIAIKVSGVDAITAKNVHKIADLDMELTRVKAMH
ncbi:hypothetical protein psyc5s11_50470 [Clostridium gelidum]|uniref:t-SNARE coiled-coil homology domain-containing protein n=1 Tax=Clostridium gelidum TaxID=704125 RepID=A0ABM7TAN4_9CLOT|nr:hypothetical protein [Clostridium gelidum]BCZ48980.1 hypothetical protein psyc5s11_50470 [Clostridium gelidum]